MFWFWASVTAVLAEDIAVVAALAEGIITAAYDAEFTKNMD
jgi:hypothetical protein